MDQIWSKRFNTFINERIFILRRLANGFAFVPVLMILLGLYYYPIFLDWLPESFPVSLILSIILAWLTTRGGFRSFLQEADVVYITPMENKMSPYFKKCFTYNVIMHSIKLLSALVIISPLYFNRISYSVTNFMIFVVLMIVLKMFHVKVLWKVLNTQGQYITLLHMVVNFIFIYGLLTKNWIILTVGIILSGLIGWIQQKNHQINWLRLIEQDQQLDARFIRWVGIFVEQPGQFAKIMHRRNLQFLTKWIKKTPEYAYHFLYLKIFIRTENLGMLLRILVIGFILLWLISNYYVRIIIYTVILMIVGLQLSSFWSVFKNHYWAYLYPISLKDRETAFLKISLRIMVFVAILLSLPVIIKHFSVTSLITILLIVVVIPYSYINFYVSKRILHY